MTCIWWIRRDVRLNDNPTLNAALGSGRVLPLFILDPHLLARTPERRQHFLWGGLATLDADLQTRGGRLTVLRGDPLEVLTRLSVLLRESETDSVVKIFAEADYTPYARSRDEKIARSLPLELVHGQTVYPPDFVHKADGKPYTVFTPYSKAWKAVNGLFHGLTEGSGVVNGLFHGLTEGNGGLADASAFIREGATKSAESLFPPGEAEAQRRLAKFANYPITNYANTRDRLDLDGTSSLSPYLRFGMLSLPRAAATALGVMNTTPHAEQKKSAEVWLNELIWREFYISILYHFPHVSQRAFNPAFQHIRWRNNQAEFEAWKHGQTGVPVVDAAMRQLLATGWMHNRARMIVASYLTKDLLIDWRWGERWFMDNLLDGDPAANNGGWQWTAGTGTDAAPYFRIFNPVLQSQKFDPEGNYIRRWVPELAHISTDVIHAPWEKDIRIPGYPSKPIVDRAEARERTLKAYSQSKVASQTS
jgi:deoxyribodipyrimidine photo-lyase